MTTSEYPAETQLQIDAALVPRPTRPVWTGTSFSPDPTIYRGILDEMEDGVYLVDRTERVLWWNRGAEAITGFSRAEVVGRTCAENLSLATSTLAADSFVPTASPLRRAFLTGVPIETSAFLHHKEGHRVAVNIKTKPLRDRNGNNSAGRGPPAGLRGRGPHQRSSSSPSRTLIMNRPRPQPPAIRSPSRTKAGRARTLRLEVRCAHD